MEVNSSGSASNQEGLKFSPFISHIKNDFWLSLSTYLVETMRLQDYHISCTGSYTTMVNDDSRYNPGKSMRLEEQAFYKDNLFSADTVDSTRTTSSTEIGEQENHPNCPNLAYGRFPSPCIIKYCKTKENMIEFQPKLQDWLNIITKRKILNAIHCGEVLNNPSLLTLFTLVVFPNLKTYEFVYYVAYPRLQLKLRETSPRVPLYEEYYSIDKSYKFINELRNFVKTSKLYQTSFFIVYENENGLTVDTLSKYKALNDNEKVTTLFGYIDPSPIDAPGWMLCNFMAALNLLFGLTSVKVLSYRGKLVEGLIGANDASVLTIEIPNVDKNINFDMEDCPIKVAGYEKIEGKLLHRKRIDDPKKMAIQAADLNISLMRWRLLPGLKADEIRRCKCLLIGSGTLGCSVAQALLGWGVPEINFVDNGKVSYSNPVRQTLFKYEHSLNGGRYKADAAAERLMEIFPGVKSKGHVLTIPMPGHDFTDRDAITIEISVEKLDELIKDHDVIFLLTDSRESRWLPTVIAARYDKMLINAALGFDTFVVMRHGGGFQESVHGECERLGCYFCNDIVAPIDSTKDRTLDQQCTVTRPGLAPIASALAVELMVSLLHHPDKHKAPVDIGGNLSSTEDPLSSSSSMEGPVSSKRNNPVNDRPLGLLPQQIRGFLSTFKMIIPTVYAFHQCTACSKPIVEMYEKDRVNFVKAVVQSLNGLYLEDLVGISKMKQEAEMVDIIDFNDMDEIL